MRAETLHQILLGAILVGLGLSLYAGYEVLNPAAASSCSFFRQFSCAAVLDSQKTSTFGVSDWIWGTAGFLALLAIDVPLYRTWRRVFLNVLMLVAGLGLVLAAYLAWVEVTQIGSLCPVCVGTYVADTIVLVSALMIYRRAESDEEPVAGSASAPSVESTE